MTETTPASSPVGELVNKAGLCPPGFPRAFQMEGPGKVSESRLLSHLPGVGAVGKAAGASLGLPRAGWPPGGHGRAGAPQWTWGTSTSRLLSVRGSALTPVLLQPVRASVSPSPPPGHRQMGQRPEV